MTKQTIITADDLSAQERRIANRIEKIINSSDVTSITLDIFDTILLRKIWPEEKRFYLVAKQWAPLFQDAIDDSITPAELSSWRNYTRGEVLSAKNTYRNPDTTPDKVYGWINYDITLQEWFQSLTELMSAKYNTALSDKQINQLVAKMTNIELATER